jgi:hypothetical protein
MLQMYFDDEYEAELKATKGRTTKEDIADVERRSENRVGDLYFFPSKVRVSGRQIEFQVPPEFLGDTPSKTWGYTIIVSGCDIEDTGRPALFSTTSTMMTLPVARGLQSSQWGIRGDVDEATPPIVDVLATDPEAQAKALDDYDMVAGRLAVVPGVAPDGGVAMAASGTPLTTGQAARIDQTTRSGGAAVGAPPAAERRTVPARLRTLNELLADGLITQAEFNELRRKILAEL